MADPTPIKISEFPNLNAVSDSTIFPVLDSGTNLKVTADKLKTYVGATIIAQSTAPANHNILWLDTSTPAVQGIGATGASGPTGATGASGPTGATGVGAGSTTGSWTLTPGVNTVSFTVTAGRTYCMWVNGNIPNGIVKWNATVSLSNTNVPAVGTQYGWYYAAGNALVLTSIPNHIVGTPNTIVTTSPATTTSNVFTFGITNNSGSTQTVYWGYITL